jgi:uncharacterized protein YecT (DUF1311 family)
LAALALASISVNTSAVAGECSSAGTQGALNDCFDRIRQSADDELNRVYQDLIDRVADQSAKTALREAERAWISYRDKECAFELHNGGGGSAYPMSFAICVTAKTRARTKELADVLHCDFSDLACPL